jgi:hypothetical protein
VPDVEVLTHRRWPPFAFALYTVLGLAVLFLAVGQGRDIGGLLLGFLVTEMGFAVALLAFSERRRFMLRRRGEVTVGADRLNFRGRSLLETRAVLQALAFREDDRHVVRLTSRRLRVFDLVVESAEEGQHILEALGQSAAQSTAIFPAIPGGLRFRLWAGARGVLGMMGTMVLAAASARSASGLNPLLVFLLGYFTVIVLQVLSTRCQVVVGTDGLAVRRPLRGQRFVPFRDVLDLHREGREIVYRVAGERSARRLTLVDRRRRGGPEAKVAAMALVQRVNAARRRAQESHALPARNLLARGSSSREDWLQRLAQLSDEAATFRTAAVPPDELWSVLGDAAETAEVRAAAALALRRQLDDGGRARVRLAAESSAEPPLRRVLTAVTGEDEVALDEALDAIAPRARHAREV